MGEKSEGTERDGKNDYTFCKSEYLITLPH